MEYKVSVIVPIYNIGKHIGKCAESLMLQTLKEVEFIFVDDCAQDDSYEVLMETLSRFPERQDDVRIIRHEVNKGLTKSRNDGLDIARGRFIAHCDGDDWVEPEMYEKLYEKAMADNAETVICNFFFAHKDGLILNRYQLDLDGTKEDFLRSYIKEVWNTIWSMLVSRELYERTGARSPEDITFTEDFHLAVRLLYESKKTSWVDEALYYYNQTNSSSIIHGITPRIQKEEIRCYEQIEEWMKQKGLGDSFSKVMGWRFLKSKCYFVLQNRFDDFRQTHPDANKHILSVPTCFCTPKTKLMMVLTMLHLDFICRWDNHRKGRF